MMVRPPGPCSRGQSMVELALILPVLLIVMVGVVDLGRAVFAYNSVANAARTATRIAIVNQTSTAIEDGAKAEAVGLDPLVVTIAYTLPGGGTCSPVKLGCIARVDVTHAWMAATPLLNTIVGPISLTSSASMPVEREWPTP